MYFVGLDLAWAARNRTGVAVLDHDGRLLSVGAAGSDDAVVDAVATAVRGDCLVAVDAPLVVPNAAGYRRAEQLLNADFRATHAIAQPANRANPLFDPPRGAVLAARLGLDVDPHSTAPRRAIEVYPHAAAVALFGLDRIFKYKRRTRDFAQRKAAMSALVAHVEMLARHDPPLRLDGHADWNMLRDSVFAASRPYQLNACEDPVDAVLCAYVGLYFVRRPETTTVYGDAATGYIVTPTRAGGAAPRPVRRRGDRV